MGHYRLNDEDEPQFFSENEYEEDIEDEPHKRQVRRRLEERLERKRLQEEMDELDGDFDWEELER